MSVGRRGSPVLVVLALVSALIVGPGADPAHAATHTWDGSFSSDWSLPDNWDAGIGASPDLVFPDVAANKANTNPAAGTDVKSMSIASGYTIGGSSIDMIVGNTGITFNTGTTSVVNLPINLEAATPIIATAGIIGTIGGGISGGFGLTKAGGGTVALSGDNTYTGATTINEATLRLGNSDAIPDASQVSLANAAGATLDLNGFDETIGTLTGGGGTGGNITLGAGTLTVNQSAALSYAGIISGTGGLIKAGAERLGLSGANAYAGATTINAGEVRSLATDVIPNGSTITFANVDGALLNVVAFAETVGGLAGGGATGGDVALGAGSLTINQVDHTSYAGEVSGDGTGTVTKAGVGTLTASGDWTGHLGTTDIAGGRLDVTGQVGAVRLAGGTLGGNGTVGDVTSQGAGGTIAPGTSPDDLSTGNLSLNAATTLTIEINGTAPAIQHDQLDVTGTVGLGTATITPVFGYTPAIGDAFTIIDNDDIDAVIGTFAGLPEGDTFVVGTRQFRITYAGGTGNDVVITTIAGTTTTALTQSLATTTQGENVTFTATIANPNGLGATPSGTVTFLDGGTAIGTGVLAGGQATFATSALGLGTHTITATYPGDAAFAASAAAAVSHTVNSVPVVAPAPAAPSPALAPTPAVVGYRLLDGVGGLHGFGAAPFLGSLPGRGVTATAVDLEHVTDGAFVLDADGGVHAFGAAAFIDSLPGRGITVGGADIETVPGGYLVLDTVGGVHAFGAAAFHGSLPGRGIPTDVVDLEAVDGGYFILDKVGGVHAFGAATFIDSLPGRNVFADAVDLEAVAGGYAVLDAAGGFHAFGVVPYHGSLPGLQEQGLIQGGVPVADLVMAASGGGYYVLERNGGVHAFNAPFLGSLPSADASVAFMGLELL